MRVQNFRSYSDESFEFDKGVNIVVGPNASGKTNLLEAVLVLARGGSYRVRDPDLIKHGKPWARIDGYFSEHARAVKLKKIANTEKVEKIYELDNTAYRRLSLDKTIPVVLFEPNHLQLITRGPEHRRDFFDDLLERTVPGYKSALRSYRRALAQRNALLKRSSPTAKNQLFAWNIRLSELGEKVASERAQLAGEINSHIAQDYSRIAAKKAKVEVEYDLQLKLENYSSRLLSKLESSEKLDFERGFTSAGPHREDFNFTLNGQRLGTTASRGEVRSLLLALKIRELELIGNTRKQSPIFLLDDVFSELDSARRRALVKHLQGHQTIITTTDADAVIEYFSGEYSIIPLS